MDLTDFKKRFKNPQFGQSQFSRKIEHLLHSPCFTAAIMFTFTCWCLYSPWKTCIHKCHRCHTSRHTHTENVQTVETVCCLIGLNQNNAAWIPLHQYHFGCYRQWGLEACFSIPCVCTLPIAPCYALFVLSMPNNTLYCCDKQHSWECVNPLDHNMHLKKWITKDI